MKKATVLATVTLAFLGYASAASATLLDFQLSCTSGQSCSDIGGGTASFQLQQFPTPAASSGYYFGLDAVPGMLNGKAVTFGIVSFSALNPGAGGVILEINPTNPVTRVILGTFGPQLFQGPVQSPELLAGEFPLRGNLLPGSGQFYNFSLIVTPDNSLGSPASVPEPATWALMMTGVAMMIGARRKQVSRALRDQVELLGGE